MTRLKVGAFLLLGLAAHACEAGTYDETGNALPAPAAAPVQPAVVSAEQFASMSWLIGDWRGSGGQYPAFYESYRKLNDTTIEQRNYSDSAFKTATDSALIVLSGGSAVSKSRGGTVNYVVQRIAGDSLYFARPNGGRGNFVWVKGADGQWTALLDGANPGDVPTIYEMRRIRP